MANDLVRTWEYKACLLFTGWSKYHLIQIFETIIADQAGVLPVVVGNIWRKLMILFC